MTSDDVMEIVGAAFGDVVEMERWGERSLFYNPDHQLPHGVYFLTVKEHDGPNDMASQLDRPGVFRVSIGAGPAFYEAEFGPRPPRPAKGGIVDTEHDFTALDTLTPHPVYGWMGWVCVLNPTRATLERLESLIAEAHRLAVGKFNQRIRKGAVGDT